MDVSIIVSTRDRGAAVVPALESMLREQGCRWEVVLVDQSATDATERALAEAGLLNDERLKYHRSASTGTSRGRNEAEILSEGEVIVTSDDDCLAPVGWAAAYLRKFDKLQDIGLIYGPVVASPRNGNGHNGWIPQFLPLREGRVEMSENVIRNIGLDANCAIRREDMRAVGPYDEMLGPGSVFGGAEDTDYGYRAMRAGIGVYTAMEPKVIHNALPGQRKNYIRGHVAMCMKHVRCGDRMMMKPVMKELRKWSLEGTRRLLSLRKPSGYRAAAGVVEGVVGSYRYLVDRDLRVYRPRT